MSETRPGGRERLFGGNAGRIALVLSAGWLILQAGRQVLPPLLPRIIADLSIAPVEAGFGLTLMWAWYAAFHYPGGRSSDRLSRKTVLVGGLGVLVAGFAVLSGSTSYGGFLVGVSLVGIGAALYYVPMRARLSDLFVERRAQAFGVNGAAGNVGSALAGGLAIAALAAATWQAAFLPVIAVLLLVAALLHRWSDEPYALSRIDLGARETAARVFETPRIRRLAAAYALFEFANQAVVGFLPTFLQVDKGFSPALASGVFALPFVVGIVVGPLAGGLGDRLARPLVAAAGLGLAMVGLLGMLAAPSVPLVVAGLFVHAVGMRAYSPVMQAYLMGLFPDASTGGDFGAFKTVYVLAGSLGPTYVGLVAGRASYTVAFAGLAVCLFAGAGIVLRAALSDW